MNKRKQKKVLMKLKLEQLLTRKEKKWARKNYMEFKAIEYGQFIGNGIVGIACL